MTLKGIITVIRVPFLILALTLGILGAAAIAGAASAAPPPPVYYEPPPPPVVYYAPPPPPPVIYQGPARCWYGGPQGGYWGPC